ncbi:MAG: metallophosphoesterase [Gammaproteobacteria bacterium]
MTEQPVLQLIHISDLHVKNEQHAVSPKDLSLMRRLRKIDQRSAQLSKLLPKMLAPRLIERAQEMVRGLENGMFGHAPSALDRFSDFVRAVTSNDAKWKGVPTCLIDTGDLTTFGDKASLTEGHDFLNQLSGLCDSTVSVYGNHDAWPTMQPIFAKREEIAAHRKELREDVYSYTAPSDPLEINLPGGEARIAVYRLNSVLHDRFRNTLALGEIQHDRYWEKQDFPHPGEQIQKLLEDAVDREENGRSLRIVLSHHPIYEPGHFDYRLSMRLINDSEVFKILGKAPKGLSINQLAHLVMSGHTHELFPAQGELSGEPVSPAQLVVGSLSKQYAYQFSNFATSHKPDKALHQSYNSQYPHQCELLRFYYNPGNPNQIRLDRLVAARAYGSGPFLLLRKNGRIAESMHLDF